MSYAYIADHIQQAKDRLIEQYKGKPKIEGMLSGLVAQFQEIEDALAALLVDNAIDDSVGVQLDGVGAIVGLARETGQSDDAYRALIKSKIVQNLNQGTPEEVIAAAKFFLGVISVWYLEVYPAEVDIMSALELTPDQAALVRIQIEKFLPAAVSLGILGTADAGGFVMDEDDGNGFGNDDESDGSGLAQVY